MARQRRKHKAPSHTDEYDYMYPGGGYAPPHYGVPKGRHPPPVYPKYAPPPGYPMGHYPPVHHGGNNSLGTAGLVAFMIIVVVAVPAIGLKFAEDQNGAAATESKIEELFSDFKDSIGMGNSTTPDGGSSQDVPVPPSQPVPKPNPQAPVGSTGGDINWAELFKLPSTQLALFGLLALVLAFVVVASGGGQFLGMASATRRKASILFAKVSFPLFGILVYSITTFAGIPFVPSIVMGMVILYTMYMTFGQLYSKWEDSSIARRALYALGLPASLLATAYVLSLLGVPDGITQGFSAFAAVWLLYVFFVHWMTKKLSSFRRRPRMSEIVWYYFKKAAYEMSPGILMLKEPESPWEKKEKEDDREEDEEEEEQEEAVRSAEAAAVDEGEGYLATLWNSTTERFSEWWNSGQDEEDPDQDDAAAAGRNENN